MLPQKKLKSSDKISRTFSIIIPALNEEKNIGNLLMDIIKQYNTYPFYLKEVIVISDNSTDRTDEIVNRMNLSQPLIKLHRNNQSMGKIASISKVLQLVDTDYVILFDADIRILNNTLSKMLKPFLFRKSLMVAGNPIPEKEKIRNMAISASYFSWILLDAIKQKQPNSVYCAHGRALALSKDIYKKINLFQQGYPGTDQYMYSLGKQVFHYEAKALITYKLPSTTKDYIKQNIRFRYAKKTNAQKNRFLNNSDFYIPNKTSIFIKATVKDPYGAAVWAILNTLGFFIYSYKQTKMSISPWETPESTK